MLDHVDRIQLTNRNAEATARRWCEIFAGEWMGTDALPALNAKRATVQVGVSLVEVLEPTGAGLVQDHLATGRGGPFAVGVAAHDLEGLRAHLGKQGISGIELGEQCLLTDSELGIPGLNVLLSPAAERHRVGLVNNLYEATHLTDDADVAASAIARVFGLDQAAFVEIASEDYGYRGALTLFDAAKLHRIETINPFDATKTMGRYFERFGPSLYMCYIETDDIAPLRERLQTLAPTDFTGSSDDPDGLFVHPKALGGTMVGVSRLTHAWTWSGYPERRVPPA
ncbi:MAG: hypothetical protein O7C67_18680 [Gammaproteobacteria bacterium]|nr:hypothetical protein [Gammaproteobacteria bacterium]